MLPGFVAPSAGSAMQRVDNTEHWDIYEYHYTCWRSKTIWKRHCRKTCSDAHQWEHVLHFFLHLQPTPPFQKPKQIERELIAHPIRY